MSSNLRYAPTLDDVVIPWNAQYEFPSAANKALKVSPRITPQTGQSNVLPGNTIQFNFPAQGYIDPRKTTISFDFYLKGFDTYEFDQVPSKDQSSYCYLQNNVASVFEDVQLKYGSYVIESVQENGYLQRQLSEFTGYSTQDNDQFNVAKGISGISQQYVQDLGFVAVNNRLESHGLHYFGAKDGSLITNKPSRIAPTYVNIGGAHYAVKRYQIDLPFGLFQQGKLIPVKYMASQLSIHLKVTTPEKIIIANKSSNYNEPLIDDHSGTPSFFLSNVTLHPEILEFDSTYDSYFVSSLESGGVPIQLPTFKSYTFPCNSSNLQLAIPEKSRFVKAIFAFVKASTGFIGTDYGASFGDLLGGNTIESYQVRVGGRYFPASPCQITTISGQNTGSSEPLTELMKALHSLNDGNLSNAITTGRWNCPLESVASPIAPGYPYSPALADGKVDYNRSTTSSGTVDVSDPVYFPNSCSPRLSGLFCMAVSLETSNGSELSGLNAEEQSDIVFNIKWKAAPPPDLQVIVYTLVDKIMVIKENNNVDIIE